MRVLVIGGTQFIGRATVAALLERGHAVTVLNRGRTASPFGSIANLEHVRCDRWRDKEEFAAVVSSGQWSAIVDFLAFEPEDVLPMISGSCATYIFISTDSVYMACSPAHYQRAGSGGLLETSDAVHDPERASTDEYGANKLATEAELRAATQSGVLRQVLALRLPDVIGPHENTGRLQRILLRLLRGKKIGTQLCGVDGSGDTLPLGIVAAADVAAAVCAALTGGDSSPASAPSGGAERRTAGSFNAYHICSSERPTWVGLVTMMAEELRRQGLDVPPVRWDAGRESGFVSVDCGALDHAAACRELHGWVPVDLPTRVRESVAWWVDTMRAQAQGLAATDESPPLLPEAGAEVEEETAVAEEEEEAVAEAEKEAPRDVATSHDQGSAEALREVLRARRVRRRVAQDSRTAGAGGAQGAAQ